MKLRAFVSSLVAITTFFLALPSGAAEYMEKTPFQLSRAFSPGVITSG